MEGSAAYAILNKTVKGLASGVKSHSVEGLTLHLEFNDGTASDIIFTQPKDGKSAYELAVDAGYSGTEEEWLESLKGAGGTGTAYEHIQDTEAPVWTIQHNLKNQHPSVVCVDEEGNQIFGDINYHSENSTIIIFSSAVKGRAFIK